jgi:PAS domain S-box-containing protein
MITKIEQITIATVGVLALAVAPIAPLLTIAALSILAFYQWVRSQNQLQLASSINHPVKDYKVADSVMLISSDGIILDCNNQVLPMFGYERSEVIGNAIEFLMDPSLQKHHVSLRNLFFITSGQRRMQNRVWALHKDGHRVHIEVFLEITSINDQSNVICSIRDITRFWKREQDLLAQNRMLENTQNIGFGILHSTLGGAIVMANGYVSRLLGYSTDECKSLSLPDIVHPSDRHVIDSINHELLDNAGAQHSETARMRNASGHYIWCRIHASLVLDTDESQVMTWVIHDISNVKALQASLELKTFEFDSLLKALSNRGEAVWIAMPGMSRILYANDAFLQQWQLNEQQMQDYPARMKSCLHADDLNAINAVYDGHMRGPWQLEYRITNSKGAQKTLAERGFMVTSASGDASVLICIQTDITG